MSQLEFADRNGAWGGSPREVYAGRRPRRLDVDQSRISQAPEPYVRHL
jgi:hypothetical protein